LTSFSWAQAPQKMSYQAVVRDAANALIINQEVGIQISLLQGSVSGDAVYVETQAPTTNDNGLFSIEIGAGALVSGSMTTIDWSKGPYFIHTETDPTGGTNYTITGTSELLSVPYALHAATAEQLTGGQLDSAGIATMGYVAGPKTIDTKLDETAVDAFVANNGYLTQEKDSSVTNEIELPTGGNSGQILSTDGSGTYSWIEGVLKPGTATGQITYWDGTAWVVVAPGTSLPGNQVQTFGFCNGVPTWGTCPAVAPILSSTTAASAITGTTVSSGGVISDDGGASVTARGVAWGTNTSPTISGSYTVDGTGTGTFTSSLTGMTVNTTYYVRAYATNSVGTAYGAEISFTTSASLFNGDTYQGGVVAYLFQEGDAGYVAGEMHGLIVATEDQTSFLVKWYNGVNTDVTTGTAIGTGLANTNAIITSQGGTAGSYAYAAGICADYSVTEGGVTYDDWFLPSKDELNVIYENQTNIGDFSKSYWSSSQYDITNVWWQYFTNGNQRNSPKSYADRVRAVRSF
jgi:hypothetical protein